MKKGKSLEKIYELRNNFIVIGLTGRTCSGVSSIANLLASEFDDLKLENIEIKDISHNNTRKYRICYNYLKENWRPFTIIKYKDVITYLMLKNTLDNLIKYLKYDILKNKDYLYINEKPYEKAVFKSNDKEINKLLNLDLEFKTIYNQINDIFTDDGVKYLDLWEIFDSKEFKELSNKIHQILCCQSKAKRVKILQIMTNNYRSCGNLYNSMEYSESKCVYGIAEVINHLIKGCRRKNNEKNECTRIVIDSLRNPIEIMFFKERYSAFYMFAINRDEKERKNELRESYQNEEDVVERITEEEYKNKKGVFYKQDVSNCIQKSDVHINNNQLKIVDYRKNNQEDIFLPTNSQLLKFITLILHPGLIGPSPQERCMQIAYTAKFNSGCLSRQVGAVISNSSYAIQSVGWNSTPEHKVPCLLRNAELILNNDIKNEKYELSEYEESDSFSQSFRKIYEGYEKKYLNGRNHSFCFKDVQNCIEDEKNQVHTRSLHAEENAFLQISKYGGVSVQGGLLFTTASPCELCAKKAHQLGIQRIYYIDPYPGIANIQILAGGSNNPELILFSGAIGRSYHKLYEPFMPYKDELSILTGLEMIRKKDQVKANMEIIKKDNERLRALLLQQGKTIYSYIRADIKIIKYRINIYIHRK